MKKYKIDLYFEDYKLAIEYDENHHKTKRQLKYDKERDEEIKNTLNCHFIRI